MFSTNVFLPTMENKSSPIGVFFSWSVSTRAKDYPSPVFPLLLTLMEVKMTIILFGSVQSLSRVRLFVTP